MAGLQSLQQDIYEAARLEDASAWQQFWTITFPLLLPLSVAVVFIRLIEALTLYAYQEGLKKFNLGYTSALSFAFLIIILAAGTAYLALLKPQLDKRVV